MTFECFKKIIDECGPYLRKIDLFNWGEPLLNNRIFRMISYAKENKISVEISSNLSFLDDDICDGIIRSGLDKLIVSLHGASDKSTSKYRKGGDFDTVASNMKKLIQRKRELISTSPFVQWRFLVNKFNEKEIPRARELAEELGVDLLEFGPFRCDMGAELLLDAKAQFENVKPWLPEDESLSMYDYSKQGKKAVRKQPCYLLWTQAVINWDGSVSPCCGVWHEKFDFGNINDSSFFEIWNNRKYQEARKISRGTAPAETDNICSICKTNQAQL
jgi:radical SAM protein with 4Fe4S-binding SPASM domain